MRETKELREYQKNVVEKVLASDKDLIICLPTGAGKTVIASSLISELNELGETVIFVVPRLELIKQAAETFGDVDIIWSGETSISGKKIIIASKDSLRTQIDKVPENPVLIFDEVHIGLEQTFNLISLIKPTRVLGLTATPERMDGKALLKGSDSVHKFGCFDELLQEETVSSLIDKGYLTPLRYYTKPIEGITEIKPNEANGQELSDEQMAEIFDRNSVWGDFVKSYEQYGIENGVKRPALGFTNTIAMAEKVAGIFCEAGYNFRVISGDMKVSVRNELINDLKTGKIDGLINAALLTYGFDCPPVSYAFSCRHIKSRPFWFQMVGRILRTCEGKKDAIFVDHGDSVSEFEEPSCSLPILNPLIKWRADGETKEEKQIRKRQQKKERESLKLLQELDPLPCEMVEIKVEDTWERMIKVLQKLKKENDGLFNLTQKLQKQSEALIHEKEELQQELKTASRRYVDKEKTFEFCKFNYCRVRNDLHEKFWNSPMYAGMNNAQKTLREHYETVERLREEGKNLSFLFDENVFVRSMSYWERNFTYKPRGYK